ncbi:serine hydrolase domain-containing protein [Winogradskyella sp. PG-2]|uniref:serine hydrolase domain-containing protein n=1 Tax=Winogradskyella sp. PG-2 TaxID=754409 RepID=UPI0004585D8A|nr:serine hydrolase domain-containing protein [Winogradskyella sp. PG-2]BAO76434.1 beta-lactamase [Winogradskyella sp. PG-2]
MKYIKALNIIFILLLLFSCKNKENETGNKIITEEINLSKEITHSEIELLINNKIGEEHFTGVVLVAVNDKIIHAKGYGMAQDGIQNSINTKFHVASITKQFTAAAIMQLLEQKKINLKESINEFLPTQYRSDKWHNVTIHNLLTQTSGIEDYGLTRNYYEVEKGFCLGNTVDGMIKEAMVKELKFPSGSKFSYSNIGYTLLGQIIENTSGEPYDSYMKKHIFEPIGMHNSFIHNTSNYTVANDEAMGYRWDDELNKHVPDDIISLPVTEPDGNLVTTLNDFLEWTSIYTNNNQKVIDDIAIKKMTTPYIKNDFSFLKEKGPWYGYGLSLTDGIISHPGYIVGFRSHFIVDTNNGIKVLVFNNNVSNNPKNVSSGIYNMISKKTE